MFCNFCGKNFEPMEGFEEVRRKGDSLLRCEQCSHEQNETEYDWKSDAYGAGARARGHR